MGAYGSLCGYTAASQNLVGVPMEDLDFNSRLTLAHGGDGGRGRSRRLKLNT